METEASVARGAAALYFANLVTLALNTGYFIVLANFLPLESVGLVSLLNIIVIVTATMSALALPIMGTGMAATPPAAARFILQYLQRGGGSARKVFLVSIAICTLVSLSLAAVFSSHAIAERLAAPLNPDPVFYAAVDAVVFSFAQLGAYSLVGCGRASLTGRLMVLAGIVRYGSASALLLLGRGVVGVFIGFSIGDAALALGANLISSRSVAASKDGAFESKPILTYMGSVLAAAMVGLGVTQTDRLLAFFQQGLGNLGVYNVATVGAAIASFAPSAVTNVLVPSLGGLGESESERRRAIMKNYTRYISIIAFPMGFGLAAVSSSLLRIFGESYLPAAPLISVMSISVAFTSVASVYSSDLLVSEHTYLFSIANVVGLAALLLVAIWLLPTIGLLGVALGRAAMVAVTLLALGVFVKRRRNFVLDSGAYLKSALCSAIMSAVIYVILSTLTSSFIQARSGIILLAIGMVPLGFALYLYLMKVFKGFREDDLVFVEQILPRSLSWLVRLARRLS